MAYHCSKTRTNHIQCRRSKVEDQLGEGHKSSALLFFAVLLRLDSHLLGSLLVYMPECVGIRLCGPLSMVILPFHYTADAYNY